MLRYIFFCRFYNVLKLYTDYRCLIYKKVYLYCSL